jgi:predicted ATPase
MQLNEISIYGFKSIEALNQLLLRPLNVVIGANGSGKSNLLSVFEFLQSVADGRLARYVAVAGGANRLLFNGSKWSPGFDVTLGFKEPASAYQLQLLATEDDGLVPHVEAAGTGSMRGGLPPRGREAWISDASDALPDSARWVREQLLSWRKYHFHDTGPRAPLRQTSSEHDNRELSADGANLPSFLRLLRERHAPEFAAILHALRRVAPFIKALVLEPLALSPDKVRLEWRHEETGATFDVSSLSDGTLRFLALATVLLQPASLRPSVIFIDEPELGLHPVAIRLLGAMMRAVSVETQLVVSTQSPLLIDEFQPEDIIVADLVQGATTLRRLEEAPLREWLQEYSLGELWEKNEFGGRP